MFETFNDSRVCVCPRGPAIPGGVFSAFLDTEGVGTETARPFAEPLAGGGARLRLRPLWNLPSQVSQNSSRKPTGPRGLGLVPGHSPCRLRPRPTHPLGRRWSGGVGRCLPQRQTPPGVSCWSRPASAGWPGVGAVRTPPGGYRPPECYSLELSWPG